MDFREYARALHRRWRRPGAVGPFSASLVLLRRVASTHLLARRIAEEYGRENLVPPPADILAWEQTAGVGREDRSWSSPAGQGIYLTSIRTVAEADRIQLLPLSVSVALCESVNRLLAVEPSPTDGGCRLKWPNDLQVGDRKLGGILIDVLTTGFGSTVRRSSGSEPSVLKRRRALREGISVAILSVGANLTAEREVFGEPRATSIDFEAARRGRGPFAVDAVAERLAAAVSAGAESTESPEDLVERYQRFSLHQPGETLRCRVESEVVQGIFEGFDRRGFLKLRVAGQQKLISSGVVLDGQ